MRIYEELFIVKADAPDEEVDQFVEQLRAQLTAAGATVDKVDKWGKRRLAYRVDKYREGTYILFQFTAGRPTEPHACSTQVVRCEPLISDPRGEFLHYVPNQFLRDSIAPGPARTAHFSEKLSCVNACRNCPVVQ